MIRTALVLLVIGGCSDGSSPTNPQKRGTTDTATTGTTTGATTGGATTGATTGTSSVYGFPYVEYDCSQGVPAPPFDRRVLSGTSSNEDIALDLDGWLIVPDFFGNVHRYSYQGGSNVLGAGFGDPTGIGVLPGGDLIVCDRSNSRLVRWHHQTGSLTTVVGNINSPNGVEVAPDGHVYVTDVYTDSVFRVDVDTGDVLVVANNIDGADGITFNETYDTLYVGSILDGDIYTIPVYGPADYGPATRWVVGANQPWVLADGLQVDRCGNVYVADFNEAVYRIDGQTREVVQVVTEVSASQLIPSMRFGSGVGDWDALKLYVSTYSEVIEVDVGVPNKARWPVDWP